MTARSEALKDRRECAKVRASAQAALGRVAPVLSSSRKYPGSRWLVRRWLRAGRRRRGRGSATGSETCRREQRFRPQRPSCVIGSRAAALRPSSTASAGFSQRGQHPSVAANSATGSGTGWQRAAAQTLASRQRRLRNPPAKAMPIIGGGRHWFEHHPAIRHGRPAGAGSATSGHQADPGHCPPVALPPNLPSSIAPATASRLRHWIKNRQCGRPRR